MNQKYSHWVCIGHLCCLVLIAFLGMTRPSAADTIVTTTVGQQSLGANDKITIKNGGKVSSASINPAVEGDPGNGNTIVVESGGQIETTNPGSSAIIFYGTGTDANVTGLAGGGPLAGGASNILQVDSGASISSNTNHGAIRVTSNNKVTVSGRISTQVGDSIVLNGGNNEICVSGSLSSVLGNSDGIWISNNRNNNLIQFSGDITTKGLDSDGIDTSAALKNTIFASGLIKTSGDKSDAFEIGSEDQLILTGTVSTTGDTAHGLYLFEGKNIAHISGNVSASGTGSYAVKSGRNNAGSGENNLFHILGGASLTGGIHNDDANDNATSFLTFGYAKGISGRADLTGQDDDFDITIEASITSDSSGNWDGYFTGGATTLEGDVNTFRHIYVGGDSFQNTTLFGGAFTETNIVNVSGAKATLNIEKNITASGNVTVGKGSTLGFTVTDSTHAAMNVAGNLTIETGADIKPVGRVTVDRENLPLITYGGSLMVGNVDMTPGDFIFDGEFDSSDTAILDRSLRHSASDNTIYMDIFVQSFNSKSQIQTTHGLTRMLDIINRSGASGDMDTLIADLQSIGTDAELQQAYTELSPVQMTATPAAVISSVQSLGDVITGHMGKVSSGVNAVRTTSASVSLDNPNVLMNLDPTLVLEERKWTPFVEFIANKGNQDNKDGISGYELKNTGVIIGTDYLVSKTLLAGLSGSYMNPSVDSNDSLASTDMDTWQASVFGRFFTRDIHMDAHAGAGYSKIDSLRQINFTGTQAVSDHDATYFTLGLGGGYNWRLGLKTELEPFFELDYVNLSEDGYQETGAGTANLNVAKNRNESIRSGLGLKISRQFDFKNSMALKPSVSYKWQHEFKDDAISSSASFVGAGSPFSTLGLKPDADHHILGAGIKAFMTQRLNIYLDYEFDKSSSYQSHNGRLGVEVKF